LRHKGPRLITAVQLLSQGLTLARTLLLHEGIEAGDEVGRQMRHGFCIPATDRLRQPSAVPPDATAAGGAAAWNRYRPGGRRRREHQPKIISMYP